MKQNRWKSPVLWSSTLSALGLLAIAYDVISIDSLALEVVINAILTILVTFGIVNNPTDKGGI